MRDYDDFYRSTVTEYALLLRSWLREDGLGGPICHNSANPNMNCQFPEMARAMGEGFLLGSDHYYTLNQSWPQNSPTPQYAIRALMSCDTMRAMGMPPSVMEMPGGSPSDTPPILPEDLLACYQGKDLEIRTWFDAGGLPLRAELALDGEVRFQGDVKNLAWKEEAPQP